MARQSTRACSSGKWLPERLSLAEYSLPICLQHWEFVNVSAGLSLAEYSLPICGPRLCGRTRGLAPGISARLDLFGPYIEGGLGVSVDCAGTWVTGSAAPVWSGVSVRYSAGPILRFASPH